MDIDYGFVFIVEERMYAIKRLNVYVLSYFICIYVVLSDNFYC